MPARIVFPFLIISTLILSASSTEAAVRVESPAGAQHVQGQGVAMPDDSAPARFGTIQPLHAARLGISDAANGNGLMTNSAFQEVGSGDTAAHDPTGLGIRRDFELAGARGPATAGDRISPPPVPEVSSWVMMITGFAFVGTAVRGRTGRKTQRAAG
jgi:hypothetical protein